MLGAWRMRRGRQELWAQANIPQQTWALQNIFSLGVALFASTHHSAYVIVINECLLDYDIFGWCYSYGNVPACKYVYVYCIRWVSREIATRHPTHTQRWSMCLKAYTIRYRENFISRHTTICSRIYAYTIIGWPNKDYVSASIRRWSMMVMHWQ